jgi:hypothetical protein
MTPRRQAGSGYLADFGSQTPQPKCEPPPSVTDLWLSNTHTEGKPNRIEMQKLLSKAINIRGYTETGDIEKQIDTALRHIEIVLVYVVNIRNPDRRTETRFLLLEFKTAFLKVKLRFRDTRIEDMLREAGQKCKDCHHKVVSKDRMRWK